MPDSRGAPQRLCASAELAERGDAVLFDVLQWGQPARGFALRIDGRVVAYFTGQGTTPPTPKTQVQA